MKICFEEVIECAEDSDDQRLTIDQQTHSGRSIISGNTSSDNHVILVNTDPCNDVDDDVACGWLLKLDQHKK
jgi:hypothetical protein